MYVKLYNILCKMWKGIGCPCLEEVVTHSERIRILWFKDNSIYANI